MLLLGPSLLQISTIIIERATTATTQSLPFFLFAKAEPMPLPKSSIFDTLLGLANNNASPSQQQVSGLADQSSLADKSSQSHVGASAAITSGASHGSALNGAGARGSADKVTLAGDILLGGLFPIHMKGKQN